MVLVFGTVCLDRVRAVSAIPEIGDYVEATMTLDALGGEAANTMLAIQALGGEAKLAGNPIGDDESGRLLQKLMYQHGLQPTVRANLNTPVCTVYVTPNGERTMVGEWFSTMDSTPFMLPSIKDADWITTDSNMRRKSRELFVLAKKSTAKKYLMDFGADTDLPLIAACDVLQVSGSSISSAPWHFCETMSGRFGCHTIVTRGAVGLCYCAPRKDAQEFPAFPCKRVVDTTGAGDQFRASMLYGLDEGMPMLECLKLAAAAGALKCATFGASTKSPSLSAVRRLIKANPEIAERYA